MRIIILLLLTCFCYQVAASCVGLGCSCSINANNMSFGTYLSTSTISTSNNVSVTCSALVAGLFVGYEIRLSKGNSSTYTNRIMLSGAHSLNYNIYTDSNHSNIWGDTSEGSGSVTDSYNLALLSVTRNYTAYGQIQSGQLVNAGNYQDTIVATVIF